MYYCFLVHVCGDRFSEVVFKPLEIHHFCVILGVENICAMRFDLTSCWYVYRLNYIAIVLLTYLAGGEGWQLPIVAQYFLSLCSSGSARGL